MRTPNFKVIVSGLVLAASIGTFSAFAHENGGEGHGMMSGGMDGMGGMMQMMGMMSEMSAEDREAMTEACMKMMQTQTSDKPETGTEQ